MGKRRPHLSAGALQALRDGEASPWDRLRARLHLWGCSACRHRLEEEVSEVRRVQCLITPDVRWPDAQNAWHRFLVLSAERPEPTPSHRGRAAIVLTASAVLLAATLAPGSSTHSTSPDLVSRMYALAAQSGHTPKTPEERDRDFARMLEDLEAKGQLRRISDTCCTDRDGEGPPDDGVLTVRLSGSRSIVVIVYEDSQHSGHFERGDVILMVSRPGLSAKSASVFPE